ncbi:unnamed protein product [Trichobilharzia regenti]|nr:unnamed protein product [Trichobilharzia regenti]
MSIKSKDMSSLEPVDIGLPYVPSKLSVSFPKRLDLEIQARKRTLQVPLDVIHSPKEDTEAAMRRFNIAKHYDIFGSLYGPPHVFIPVVDFNIEYFKPVNEGIDISDKTDNENSLSYVQPVFYGNLVSACKAQVSSF